MILNHLNLVVADVAATANFFIKHFSFEARPSPAEHIKILHGSDNFVLIISKLRETDNDNYPADFHIGFYQPDRQSVDVIHEKLIADNIEPGSAPRKIRDRYGFYFYAPGKILVEITCPQDEDVA